MPIAVVLPVVKPLALFALRVALGTLGIRLVMGVPVPSPLPQAHAPTLRDGFLMDKEIFKRSSRVGQRSPEVYTLKDGPLVNSNVVGFVKFHDDSRSVFMAGVEYGAPAGWIVVSDATWQAVFRYYAEAR